MTVGLPTIDQALGNFCVNVSLECDAGLLVVECEPRMQSLVFSL